MGEREQLAADIRAALDFRVRDGQGGYRYIVTDHARELLRRALALLEPEEPARPEQCPECDGWSFDSDTEPCAHPWHFGGEQ